MGDEAKHKGRGRLRIMHYALCIVILLVAVALRLWVVQVVTIGGDGCEPTLLAGDRVAVMKRSYASSTPRVGEWVAFADPRDGSSLCVGSIFACPGDTLWIDAEGRVGSRRGASDLVVVPHAGQRLMMDQQNIRLYNSAINTHEPLKSTIVDDQLYILGEAVDDYRFTIDYYWIATVDSGLDSNVLGLIPVTSICGRVGCVLYGHDPEKPLYNGWRLWRKI